MKSRYLGRVSFSTALEQQEELWLAARGEGEGCLLGFESDPVITLGVRGQAEKDIVNSSADFQVLVLDRGGQATLHNPGQLVIFPVVNVREFGARRWIDRLSAVTVATLREFGVESFSNPDCPGVYTSRGKIMSCGVRIRNGVSTHGIAINVCNDVGDFRLIRSCGISDARIDRVGQGVSVEQVFHAWVKCFS